MVFVVVFAMGEEGTTPALEEGAGTHFERIITLALFQRPSSAIFEAVAQGRYISNNRARITSQSRG